MMMSKPSDTEEEAPPTLAPAALNVGSVADLERRLAEMGTQKKATPPPPAFPAAPVVQAPAPAAAAPAALKGGKNALLARIMAAKEKQQKKPAPPPPAPAVMAPPPTTDLLGDFDAPTTVDLPPPSYETNFLKDVPPPAFDAPPAMPAMDAPPAFDLMEQQMQFPPPPPMDSVLPPPPPLNDVLPPPPMPEGDLLDFGMPSAPTASAPMFEDLHTQQPQEFHPPPMPPPMEAAPPELDIDASILNALEPAEREAFLEEQRKILAQIEQEKSNNEASAAAARAIAFDQRSSNAVANVAASYERGGAPQTSSNMDDAEVAQMLADAELAQKLQKEEYARSEQRRSNRTGQSSGRRQTADAGQSWYDWLTGTPAAAPATRSAATTTSSSGVTSSRSGGSSSGGGGLVSAIADESVGLMSGSGNSSSGARVAEQKSMFSCVAGSMNSAVTQMYAFQSDEDGNVHGVDSQGLLAMPDVSRQRE